MRFTRLAFFALPILSAFAAPAVEPKGLFASQTPTNQVVSILGKLQTDITAPLGLLTTSDSVDIKAVNVSDVQTSLTTIDSLLTAAINNLNSIKTPSKGLVPFISGLFGGDNQASVPVSAFLADIITQIQTGITATTKEVEQTPQITNLLGSIGVKLGRVTTIVDGIIPGVLALVKKLLGGLLSGTTGTKLLVSLKSALGIH